MLPVKTNQAFLWIGTIYGAFYKAKVIANHFRINRRVPPTLSDEDINDIDFLYDLIQGREVSSPQLFDSVRIGVRRVQVPVVKAIVTAKTLSELKLASYANVTFLGENIHVDKLVHVITNARIVTKKSELTRLLRQPGDTVNVRFVTTPESKQTMKLGDLSASKSA